MAVSNNLHTAGILYLKTKQNKTKNTKQKNHQKPSTVNQKISGLYQN